MGRKRNPAISDTERQRENARKKKWLEKRKTEGRPYKSSSSESFSILRIYAEQYVESYLKEHPCADCGYSDVRALEFDHVRGKKKETISAMVPLIPSKFSLVDLTAEIAKCDVRCSNCHQIRHKENRYRQ